LLYKLDGGKHRFNNGHLSAPLSDPLAVRLSYWFCNFYNILLLILFFIFMIPFKLRQYHFSL